jgi:hypothetical protein
MDSRVGRIGTFFILIGCVLLVLFVGSVIGKGFNVLYLLLGAVALFLGSSLRRRSYQPQEPTRFDTIRKAGQRARERREERQARKKQKKK